MIPFKVEKPCHVSNVLRKVGETVHVSPDLAASLHAEGYGSVVRPGKVERATAEPEEDASDTRIRHKHKGHDKE